MSKLQILVRENQVSNHDNLIDSSFVSINLNNDYIPLFTLRFGAFSYNYLNILNSSNISIADSNTFNEILPSVEIMMRNQFINKYINDRVDYRINYSPSSAKTKMYFDLQSGNYEALNFIKSIYKEEPKFYQSGYGVLIETSKNGMVLNTMYCLTVKKEAIPILLLELKRDTNNYDNLITSIPSKFLKLYYRKELDSKNCEFPHAQSVFKKNVKTFCNENQIVMEEIDNFSKFFNRFATPKITSLGESKKILKNEAIKRAICQM